MRINDLELRNFKSWEHSGRLRFAPITALFGSNSSGKTSFLQSLLLLKQTTDSADRGSVFDLGGPASLTELGTFTDVLFQHDASRRLGVSVSWSAARKVGIEDTAERTRMALISSSELRIDVDVALARASPVVQRVTYLLGDQDFTLRRKNEKGEYELVSDSFSFRRVQGRAWPLPHPNKFYGFPDQVRAYYQNAAFLSDIELAFENMCGQIYYLGPLRDDPRRQYTWSGNRPADLGKRGERAVDALVASALGGKRNHRGFTQRTFSDGRRARTKAISVQQNVAEWLKELGLIHSFSVQAIDQRETLYQVLVRRSPGSAEVLLTDVGFGVSQVLPVLVLLAYVPEGSVVLLEQPEIHLHPAVQTGLADIFIEVAKVRDVQVVVESHSEHLLLRLQRRIAEEGLRHRRVPLAAEDCALYFCDTRGGRSVVEQLELDLYGNITNWPTDFFGNSLEEATAMTVAAAERTAERTADRA